MVILIGGASCTGKTLLAQRLLERVYFPYWSVDHLKMGLIRGTGNCGFAALDGDRLIGEKLWPILEGVIRTNIENRQSLILEGCSLFPDRVQALKREFPGDILSLWIGFSETYIRTRYREILSHRSAIERRLTPEERTPGQMIAEHREQKALCEKSGSTYFEIAGAYEGEAARICDWVAEQIL